MLVWFDFKFIYDLLHIGYFLGERSSFSFLIRSFY